MAGARVAEIEFPASDRAWRLSALIEPHFDVAGVELADGCIFAVRNAAAIVGLPPLQAVADRDRARLRGVDAESFPPGRSNWMRRPFSARRVRFSSLTAATVRYALLGILWFLLPRLK